MRSPGRSSCRSRPWRSVLVRAKRKIRNARHPLCGAARAGCRPDGCRPFWVCCTSCSTRGTRATAGDGPRSPRTLCRGHPPRRARSPTSCRTSRKSLVCWLFCSCTKNGDATVGPTRWATWYHWRNRTGDAMGARPAIDEGEALVDSRLAPTVGRGPYQIQAAIAACHASPRAQHVADTDWPRDRAALRPAAPRTARRHARWSS